MARRDIGKSIDWMTFSVYLGLIAVGWMMIFTVGYGKGYPTDFSGFMGTSIGKQSIWILISITVFLLIQLIEWKVWRTFASLIYIISMLGLILVLIFGTTIKGATSWFQFGSFSLQPSEFAKFGTCVALAGYLSTYGVTMRDLKAQIAAIGIFAIPMGLILMQPDAGSALVFLGFFVLLFRAGFPSNFFVISIIAGTLLTLGLVNPPKQIMLWLLIISSLILVSNFKNKLWLVGIMTLAGGSYYFIKEGLTDIALIANLLIFIVLAGYQWYQKKQRTVALLLSGLIAGGVLVFASNFAFNKLDDHQQERIKVWLKPEDCDPQGAAYNLVQSKMAIGSGGLTGKGFTKGNLTQGNFVPEQVTDFIFSTAGEEQGFVGSFAIIALFWLLLMRIVFIAERQRSEFSKYYAYGVAGIIFIHVLINIGMTMGLMPIIGIPLPFISKGGSSLLGFTLLLAVLLKLDTQRYSA
jgi:rod shape determining protein RodA